MIWEAALFATARTTPDLRRLGLVGDAIALRSRALRQRAAWAGHERRCHAFVLACARASAPRRTLVVLGSGLLRDVPLTALASLFGRIVLVDAVHLLPARLAARRAGAGLVVADLSGGDAPAVRALHAEPEVDLVISANLLSQMPLPHRRRSGDWDDPEPLRRIGRRHLADLAGFRAPVCLLTDLGYRDVHRDGSEGEEWPLVAPGLLPPPDESWDWTVAPPGEIDRRFARLHRVGAWRFSAEEIARHATARPEIAKSPR